MSCATVEPPTEAEMSAALVFTVDGYSDADGVDHVTAAESAVRAAEQARPTSRTRELNRLQIERIDHMALTVRSEALRRALTEAARLVKAGQDAGDAHTASEEALRHLPDDAPEAAIQAARAEEIARDTAQRAAWAAAWDGLLAVGKAPFDGLGDLVIRADAVTILTAVDGEPAEEDARASLASLRDGVVELDANRVRDPEDVVAGAVWSFRRAANDLAVAQHLEPDQAEPKAAQALKAMADAVDAAARGRAIDLDQLLFKVAGLGRMVGIDVGSYRARDELIAKSGDGVGFHLMIASIAADIAALRDAQLPSDWRGAMVNIGNAHPNGRDAVFHAYDKSMHLGDLTNIQVNRQPEKNLPILSFADGPEKFFTVGPETGYVWGPVQ